MGWSDIMNILSKAPEAGALKVHLEAAWKKEEELNERIGKLVDENTALQRENRALRDQVAVFVKEKEAQKNKAVIIDIGPCVIKKYPQGPLMNGFYCGKCARLLCKDLFVRCDEYKFLCESCRTLTPVAAIEKAFADFLTAGGNTVS